MADCTDNQWVQSFQDQGEAILGIFFFKFPPLPQSQTFFIFPTPIFYSNLKSLFQNNSQKLSPQHIILKQLTKTFQFKVPI